MLTDTFFNFYKLTETIGIEQGAEILTKMAEDKPLLLLDTGVGPDDIWKRSARFSECLELIDDDEVKKNLLNSIHFTAGIMPDRESIENRFNAVETLENTINDFMDSGEEFSNKIIAIGPCGIDHDWESIEYEDTIHDYYDHRTIDDERNLFALQITLAKKFNLPVIVHSRNGFKDTIDVLKTLKWNKGIIHGFNYSKSELDFFLDLGWYIGFNGSVTYSGKDKLSDVNEMLDYIPKDRLVIETNSPYYAPVPLKSTINNPSNIEYVYQYIATKRDTTIRKLKESVENNCKKLFGI